MKTANKDILEIFALLSQLKDNQEKLKETITNGFDRVASTLK